jgi:hypothetical protein
LSVQALKKSRAASKAKSTPPKQQSSWGVAMLLAIAVLAFWLMRSAPVPSGGEKERPVPIVTERTQLLFVSDKQHPTIEQDLLMRAVPAFVTKHGLMGFRWVDDNEPDGQTAIAIAAQKGVSPPLVAVVNGAIQRVAPWPKDENELARVIQ